MNEWLDVELPSHEARPQLLGRRRKDPAERRNVRLQLFLNDAEETKLKADAKAAGLSVPRYVRSLIDGKKLFVRGTSSPADPRLLNELNAIGNNLNQANKYGHIGGDRQADWDELRDMLESVLVKVALGLESEDVH